MNINGRYNGQSKWWIKSTNAVYIYLCEWCDTDHGSKHLLRVSLATCQLPAFSYARLRINSSTSRQVQYLMHTFVSICPKPIKKKYRRRRREHQTVMLLFLYGHIFSYRQRPSQQPLDMASCFHRSMLVSRCFFMGYCAVGIILIFTSIHVLYLYTYTYVLLS